MELEKIKITQKELDDSYEVIDKPEKKETEKVVEKTENKSMSIEEYSEKVDNEEFDDTW